MILGMQIGVELIGLQVAVTQHNQVEDGKRPESRIDPVIKVSSENMLASKRFSRFGKESMSFLSMAKKSRNLITSLKGENESFSSDSSSVNSDNADWRLGDYINTGSIGAVYRALECNTAKLITIKFLDVKEVDAGTRLQLLTRLQEEFDKIKEMKDKNIVKYIKVSVYEDDEDMIAIAMEYVPGGSITYLLQFFKSFKEPLVKIYINQVVKALQRLHRRGIVHRDLKNSNLMVDDLGTVKLSDFGFIKSLYEEL
jgi:hypothetical protein